MTDLFSDVATIDYPIIDADAHVNEPPQLWQERVPARWRQRAPRVERSEGGDVWVFDGGRERWPVGMTAVAGQSYFQMSPSGQTYETMRPGSFDTKARLEDMDHDGIYAQVLYPSVTLKGAGIYSDERELQLCCVKAYNDWLLEFCEASGGRLIPQAIIPTTGIDDALAELQRALEVGHRGAVISSFPNGSLSAMPEDERFWARAEEADLPLAVHIGSFQKGGRLTSRDPKALWNASLKFVAGAVWSKAGGQTLSVVCDILFSGIFERHPRLKVVLVESNIGWIPTLLEQADDNFRRYRWWTGAHELMRELPSRVFCRNFWATFMIDRSGVELRHRMNLDHLLWSTDYPHSGSDWPESYTWLERNFLGVPSAHVRKMCHENAKRLYHLDHIPDQLPGWSG